MAKQRYLIISWEQFHADARALAAKLVNRTDLKKIVCVTRGGLFPAAVLARELEIRWIDTVCVAGYDEEERGTEASLLKIPEGDGEGMLVVDDLVDSGRTGKIIRQLLPKAYFVTMYAKPPLSTIMSSGSIRTFGFCSRGKPNFPPRRRWFAAKTTDFFQSSAFKNGAFLLKD